MPKLDLNQVPASSGSLYPEPYRAMMAGRSTQRLGKAAGLTQFGVNLVTLQPGGVASLRHWHLREDEFAMVTSGVLVLIEDDGETAMNTGDCAAWKAGVADAHRFVNRSDEPASFLVIGTSHPDEVATYHDVDFKIHMQGDQPRFTYHDGSPWTGHRELSKGDKK